MRREFVITSTRNNSKCQLEYTFNGYLVKMEITDATEEQQRGILANLPKTIAEMEELKAKYPTMKITEKKLGIEFEDFWKTYDYPVGKITARKRWDKLSEADRILAITGIKEYDKYLARKGTIQKLHPATYLNQRRFDDDYSKL